MLNWAYVRSRQVTILQVLLIVDAVMWVAFSWTSHAFWVNYSDDGVKNKALIYLSLVFGGLAESIEFAILELVVCGNGVTRTSSYKPAVYMAGGVLCLILMLYWLFLIYGALYLYVMAASYLALLAILYVQLRVNIRRLEERMCVMSDEGSEVIGTEEWNSYRMLKMIQISACIFIICLSCISLLTIFVLKHYPWIAVSIHWGILFNCYVVFFVYFHFRRAELVEEENPIVRRTVGMYKNGFDTGNKEGELCIVGELVVIEQPNGTLVLGSVLPQKKKHRTSWISLYEASVERDNS